MNKSIIATLVILVILLITVQDASSKEKIYDGETADAGQFPFMATIYYKGNNVCGASLIGSYYLLTAAQCVSYRESVPKDYKVYSGSNLLNETIPVGVARLYIHPDYDAETYANDIAVVELKTPYAKSSGVRAIQVGADVVSIGAEVYYAGWGPYFDYYTTESLLYGTASVIKTATCKAIKDFENVNGAKQFCSRVTEVQSPCGSDFGGPVFTGDHASAVQYGVLSWNNDILCSGESSAEVSTRVSYYYDWIVAKTVRTVATACVSCTTDPDWRDMCTSIGGTYKKTTKQYQCQNLDIVKQRKINYQWDTCTNDLVKDFCGKIGRYSCSNGKGKCTRL